MPSSSITDTTAVHVGIPSPNFQAWTSTHIYFHNPNWSLYPRLGDVDSMRSPKFVLLGREWKLDLVEWIKDDGNGTISLILCSEDQCDSIKIDWNIHFRDLNGVQVICGTIMTKTFVPGQSWGMPLSDPQAAFTNLDRKTFGIEVIMKHSKQPPRPFIPPNPVRDIIQKLLMDEEYADIYFKVGGYQTKDEERLKRAKHVPTTFPAHSFILKQVAPLLADLCQSTEQPCTIEIPSVDPIIFNHVLRYIYGEDIIYENLEISEMKDIIIAADRYGLINLKLESEAKYVLASSINADNMIENLLFADSINCALLKETLMNFIVENKVKIIERNMLKDAPEGISNDILSAMVRVEDNSSNNTFTAMSINELRRECYIRRLDVDGSREMLISALRDDM